MFKLFFLIIGMFITPFYFFSSGSLQPSHIFYLLFAFLVFLKYYQSGIDKNSIKLFFPFYLYVFLINLIYTLIYQDTVFLKYPLAMTLNAVVYLSIITYLIKDNFKSFLINRLSLLILLILLMLIFLWLIGLGEYRFSPRYNGFFNDPNQMAFFVLCSSAIACLFSRNFFQYLMIVVCALFLVTLTMSRSGLLGIFFLFISFLLYFWKSNYKSIAYVIFFCLTFFAILIFNADVLVNTVLVQSYIDRAANTSLEEQADIRGYTRIINYSEYLLFGAGQGLDSRFGLDVEIHSTWAAFLFYYGVFGFSLFMYLIIKIFINLNIKQKLLFLAPLMYSFSTFGARTIIFWIFVAFFYYAAYYVNKDRVKGL
jgi:hypothetical protein